MVVRTVRIILGYCFLGVFDVFDASIFEIYEKKNSWILNSGQETIYLH